MTVDREHTTAPAAVPDLVQTLMAPAAEPPFLDELEQVWGRRWGAWDEVGKLHRVLVRSPGEALAQIDGRAWDERAQALVDPNGMWYWTDREPPDLERVADQHAGLVAALAREGIEVVVADPIGDRFVKAMYVRDPLITVPGGAIIGRMAVIMRRGEEADMTRQIAREGMPILATITGSGTLEGGSFVKLRPGLAAFGTSIRCNEEGARQLRDELARIGWELIVVPLAGYSIHLDLHLAMVDRDKAIVDPSGLPYSFLHKLDELGIQPIHPDPGEAWSVNALCLEPGRVLMAEGSPRTAEALADAGVEVVTIPYDELHKNGGGIHCSTMELVRAPAGG
jgi:N-dimethylarginine dimethylaminohydrolase